MAAMARYNPTARAASRTMPTGDPTDGYPSGSTTPGYTDYRNPANNGPFYQGTTRQQYNDDPNARKLHSPGSSRGEQSGFKPPTPSQGGPVGTPESDAAWEEMRQRTEREAFARRGMPFSNMQEWKDSDPQYVALRDAFKNATDPRAKAQALKAANDYDTRRQMQFKSDNARNAFIAQGGQGSTWDNRFSNENNWPRPTSSIGYSHGPGRPDYATRGTNPSPYGPGNTAPGVRRGATPQANAPMSAGAPPSANPMFEGYLGGGAGVPSGGSGNWGPAGGRPVSDLMYVPGRDGPAIDSGWWNQGGRPVVPQGGGNPFASMGGGAGTVSGGQGGQFGGLQNWMAQAGGYNPGASTGSAGLYNDASLYDSPMAAQGRTAPWQGTAPGGRQPIGPFNPTIDPSTRPGSAPSWASAQPGYAPFNPGNFSMPYDTGGMWQMFGGSPMGGGMNYAQMQNYLGLQPQGAPNWIGL